MTRGGASFGTFPFENFAPLSPCRCLRSFSSSLRSRVRMNVFFIENYLWLQPPPATSIERRRAPMRRINPPSLRGAPITRMDYVANFNHIHSILHIHRFPAPRPSASGRCPRSPAPFRAGVSMSGKTSRNTHGGGIRCNPSSRPAGYVGNHS